MKKQTLNFNEMENINGGINKKKLAEYLKKNSNKKSETNQKKS